MADSSLELIQWVHQFRHVHAALVDGVRSAAPPARLELAIDECNTLLSTLEDFVADAASVPETDTLAGMFTDEVLCLRKREFQHWLTAHNIRGFTVKENAHIKALRRRAMDRKYARTFRAKQRGAATELRTRLAAAENARHK